MHQAALAWDLTPENWSGAVEVVSALDGRVVNQGVARYRQLEGRHLDPQGPRIYGTDVIALKARTRQSRIEVAEAARTRVYRGGEELEVARSTYQTRGLRPAGAGVRRARGRARAGREDRRRSTRSRDRGISEPLEARGQERRPLSRASTRPSPATRGAWDELWEVCDVAASARGARPVPAALPHLAPPAGLLAAHRPPRRRRPGPRPQRRGVPRARLLGRALRLSLPQLPAAADHAGAAPVPLPADRRGPRGGPRGRLPRGDVPLAERQRRPGGDPDRPPQPALGALGAGPQPQPAPRQRGDLLQRLALPPGHARPRLPARLRRRDDAGDRALLGLDRALQPRRAIAGRSTASWARTSSTRSTRAPPREACATTPTRTSWWPGSAETAQKVLELLPASRRDALRARIGLTDEEIAQVAGDEPQDVRPLPRATASSASSRATRTSRSSTGTAYRARHGNIQRLDRILRAEGDDPNRYKLAKQADTRDAVLPVPRRRAAAALRAARLRALARHRPQDDRVLRPADLPRLDAELHRPRRRPGRHRSRELVGAVPGRAARATSATSRAARPRRASTWA